MEQTNFALEKDLQSLIEQNLETLFKCRFISNDFSIGPQSAGKIDSLALSADNNPVIIEYKTVESSELINQSLFYSHLIQDYKNDFGNEVKNRLGNDVKVNWSDIRVICIAPNYKPFDVHAAQIMGANLELWKYRLFTNNSLYLEAVLDRHSVKVSSQVEPLVEVKPATANVEKDPAVESNPPASCPEVATTSAVLVRDDVSKNKPQTQAAKKAELNRPMAIYTLEGKPKSQSELTKELMGTIREFIISLNESIEEVTKKFYVAYKTSQTSKNFACVELKAETVQLFLNLKPSDIQSDTLNYKDVSKICHYGTGDVEFTVSSESDFEPVKAFIAMSYKKAER